MEDVLTPPPKKKKKKRKGEHTGSNIEFVN